MYRKVYIENVDITYAFESTYLCMCIHLHIYVCTFREEGLYLKIGYATNRLPLWTFHLNARPIVARNCASREL